MMKVARVIAYGDDQHFHEPILLCIGYSGSDLQALCEEAAMMPIRELGTNILTVKANQVTHSEIIVVCVCKSFTCLSSHGNK